MSDVKTKATKSSKNWPVMIAAGLCVAFIVGVWVNNYRVSHAAPATAPMSTAK
jgi:hypothetical protein